MSGWRVISATPPPPRIHPTPSFFEGVPWKGTYECDAPRFFLVILMRMKHELEVQQYLGQYGVIVDAREWRLFWKACGDEQYPTAWSWYIRWTVWWAQQ